MAHSEVSAPDVSASGYVLMPNCGHSDLISNCGSILSLSDIFCLRELVIEVLHLIFFFIGEVKLELELRLDVVSVINIGLLVG